MFILIHFCRPSNRLCIYYCCHNGGIPAKASTRTHRRRPSGPDGDVIGGGASRSWMSSAMASIRWWIVSSFRRFIKIFGSLSPLHQGRRQQRIFCVFNNVTSRRKMRITPQFQLHIGLCPLNRPISLLPPCIHAASSSQNRAVIWKLCLP